MSAGLFWTVGGLYVAAGVVILSVYLRDRGEAPMAKLFNAPVVLLFWPLSLQALLARHPPGGEPEPERAFSPEIDGRLRQIERASADCAGWISELVARQMVAIRQACHDVGDWRARLLELEGLLEQPEYDEQALRQRWQGVEDPAGDSAACLQNIRELRRLRGEYRQRIDRFHLRLERVGSQLMVLRFCDARSDSAEQEIEQLITLVDSLRETKSVTEAELEPLSEGES